MITLILISCLCFILTGISKGVSDTVADHFDDSIFSNMNKFNPNFWDKRISSKNKYKEGRKELGPKFPLSTTLFVYTTDAWHRFNFYQYLFILLGILFIPKEFYIFRDNWSINIENVISVTCMFYLSKSLGFNATYDWLFKLKTWK